LCTTHISTNEIDGNLNLKSDDEMLNIDEDINHDTVDFVPNIDKVIKIFEIDEDLNFIFNRHINIACKPISEPGKHLAIGISA
jgi:hypothetical protein